MPDSSTAAAAPGPVPGLALDSADYELRWPREVFARELATLRSGLDIAEQRERIAFLLEEAFLGETPMHEFQAACSPDDPWSDPFWYLDQLVERLPQLREHRQPKPYWPARHGRERLIASRTIAQHRFAALATELRDHGYFGRDLPPPCVDDYDPAAESALLAARLGIPDLWPLQPDAWDEDTFYGLIEVFHDLAVRPRKRNMHSYNGCGWHYSAFATDTGRTLYRLKVNKLLESAGVELRLAGDGEDLGRLVRVVDHARTDLIERVLATPDPAVASRVEHAIALFRGRDATEHDKRSAAITLAGFSRSAAR